MIPGFSRQQTKRYQGRVPGRRSGHEWTKAACVLILAVAASVAAQEMQNKPMPLRFEDTARYRWMHKPVLEARLLDDMEDLAPWSRKATFGYAVPVPPHAEMTLSTEYFKSGEHAIRFRSRTDYGKPGPQMGRPFGSESIVRNFDGEDWSAYNRLSFWVRPEIPGFHVVSLLTSLHNDGKIELPGKAGVTSGLARLGLNFLILNNHAWNHVVWEIPDLPRDKVTGIEFQYRLQGHEPGAADQVTYYFDRLELERVNADYFEGWNVAPGRIAYSHSGYQAGASKTAIASGLDAGYFQVIDQATGETALKKSVSREKTNLGEFLVLNFSELRRPGEYLLRVGDMVSQPFRIGPDIWTDTIWKSMNYFFCQRCGYSVPGIHGVCHRDWQGVHGDRRIIINGGWHDAGDTCQGLANTGEAVYAMFSLAERLRLRGEHPELARRLVEEGRWGLEWILKTSFGDGFRIVWATHDFWTDGILDDFDDVTAPAVKDSGHNFVAASAEAIASRVYREEDSVFASYCLKSAQADWRSAVEGSGGGTRRFGPLQTASAGVLASVELFRVAGDRQYADEAVRLADVILSYQQRTYLRELDFPLAGFFWESPAKEFMLHESHLGDMQGPVLALTQLCEAFPAHPEWMRWYTGVVLYSEYLKAIARYTEPYGMLPESLYKGDEYLRLPEKPKDVLGYRMPSQLPRAGVEWHKGGFPVLPPAVSGLVRKTRQSRDPAAESEGSRRRCSPARRPGVRSVGRAPARVGCRPQPFLTKHHDRRGLRFCSPLQRNVRQHCRLTSSRYRNLSESRHPLLACAQSHESEGNLGAPGRSVDLERKGSGWCSAGRGTHGSRC
jgi:hypothetical protein